MRIAISMRALLVLVAVVALAVGTWVLVDWLVVTDAERIDGMLTLAARAAERHDIDFIVDQCLDPDFRLDRLDREGTRSRWKGVFGTFKIVSVQKYSAEVKVNGDTAEAVVKTFVKGGRLPGDFRLDWEFELRRGGASDWRITKVRVFHFVGGQRLPLDLEEIMRNATFLQG